MRNIMQTVVLKCVQSVIKSFEHTKVMVLQNKLDKMSIYLPLHVVFEILEECLVFRLSRPN